MSSLTLAPAGVPPWATFSNSSPSCPRAISIATDVVVLTCGSSARARTLHRVDVNWGPSCDR